VLPVLHDGAARFIHGHGADIRQNHYTVCRCSLRFILSQRRSLLRLALPPSHDARNFSIAVAM
jgi:hypothetical protein